MTSKAEIVEKLSMKRKHTSVFKNSELSNRQLRVGELVRRTISDILVKEDIYDEILENVPITVSEVRCSSDLKLAKVYVIPLGGKNSKQVVTALIKYKGEIRKILSKKLNMKFIPDLKFVEDLSFDQVEKTNKLFSNPDVKRDLEDL